MGHKVRKPPVSLERTDFKIGESTIPLGTRTRLELPVARLAVGTMLSLPVEVVHGRQPGPTIWLSAAIHGDELNGVPIIRRTLQKLDPETLCGTVVAVPVVNVFGLVTESRYLPDRRDLNRNFPGRFNGALASQLAKLFMTEVVSQCDLGLDFHTGSGGRANLPQIRCNLDDRKTRIAARKFGGTLVLHSKLRDGSLRAAAGDLGIRCLLFEAGEASRLDNKAIQAGVDGTLRVMHHLGMISESPADSGKPPRLARTSRWIRAKQSGFLELVVPLGARVEKGAVVARVFSMLEDDEVVMKAPEGGYVIGHQTTALVHRGDAVVHFVPIPK